MAEVATVRQSRINFLLDYLTTEWQKIPAVAREIDSWDLIEQIDYVEEWAPLESFLIDLDRAMSSPGISPEQRARYEELQRIIERNRPLLDELRRS